MAKASKNAEASNGTATLDPPANAAWMPGVLEIAKGGTGRLVALDNIEPAPPDEPAVDTPKPEAPKPAEATDEGAEAIEWKARMRASAIEVRRLERIADEKADLAKRAKKAFEAAASDHFDLELEEPEPMPLFDGKPKAAKPSANGVPKPSPDADDAAGLAESVSKLAVAPGIVKALDGYGMRSIGDIADFTSTGKKLADVPGLGKSKAEILEAALAGFWDARRAAAITAPESTRMAAGEPVAPSPDQGAENPSSAPDDAVATP